MLRIILFLCTGMQNIEYLAVMYDMIWIHNDKTLKILELIIVLKCLSSFNKYRFYCSTAKKRFVTHFQVLRISLKCKTSRQDVVSNLFFAVRFVADLSYPKFKTEKGQNQILWKHV